MRVYCALQAINRNREQCPSFFLFRSLLGDVTVLFSLFLKAPLLFSYKHTRRPQYDTPPCKSPSHEHLTHMRTHLRTSTNACTVQRQLGTGVRHPLTLTHTKQSKTAGKKKSPHENASEFCNSKTVQTEKMTQKEDGHVLRM
jgi:hypothetical protein